MFLERVRHIQESLEQFIDALSREKWKVRWRDSDEVKNTGQWRGMTSCGRRRQKDPKKTIVN